MASKTPQPHAVRKFQVNQLGDIIGDVADVLDVGACLSKLNHRLYRQGRNYRLKVSLDTRTLNDANAEVAVYALMPTWYVMQAWKMGKKAYDAALADEKSILSEHNLARWRDFRVGSGFLNVYEAGTLNPIQYTLTPTPAIMEEVPFTVGEFNWSRVENLDTGANMNFSWPSTFLTANEFDLMQEFADSRNESSEPQTVISDMPYHELMSDANDTDYIELQANGNEPPYNRLSFPTACWVKVGTLHEQTGTGNGWISSTGYFDAPCGLVIIDTNETLATQLHVEVQKGDYRGVHAPAM